MQLMWPHTSKQGHLVCQGKSEASVSEEEREGGAVWPASLPCGAAGEGGEKMECPECYLVMLWQTYS